VLLCVILFISAFLFIPFLGISPIAHLDIYTKLAILYAVALIFSVSAAVSAFRNKKYPKPNNFLALTGMLLFLLCDINVVMLYNLGLPSGVTNAAHKLIWVFYLPSQLFLAVSAFSFEKPHVKT
jgi:hypothetical protein